MTNRAELRRLAEAVRDDYWSPDVGMTTAETMYACAAAPGAVLSLLDECDKLQADTSSMRGSLKSYAENMKKQVKLNTRLQRERDAALAELEAYKRQLQALIHISDATGWERHTCGEIAKARSLVGGVRG